MNSYIEDIRIYAPSGTTPGRGGIAVGIGNLKEKDSQ